MPGLQNYSIITPNSDRVGVLSATGFDADIPLYTASDATPRTQTHSRCNTSFTTLQEALIEAPVTGARDVFPNSDFVQYNRKTQSTTPADRLLALGLTTSPT